MFLGEDQERIWRSAGKQGRRKGVMDLRPPF